MKMDDLHLMAYVDGELSPNDRHEVEREMSRSVEVSDRVALLKASQLPYQEAFSHQKLPPVPESLTRKIEEMARAAAAASATVASSKAGANDDVLIHGANNPPSAPVRSRLRNAPAWAAVAFVVGVFCGGAALRLMPEAQPGLNSSSGLLASVTDRASPWVRAAAGYQELYSRDTVAELQPDMASSAQTVNEIRKLDGLALHVPDLSAAGLKFKRVQRLTFNGKPLVQIVYLPNAGAPVALCVMKESKPNQTVSQQRVSKMDVATWRQDELSYALIGEPNNVDLKALGNLISTSRTEQMFSQAAALVLG
jgi:anti-sigma factor RsiW